MKNEYLGRDLEAMSFALNYHEWVIRDFRPYLGHLVVEVGAGLGDFTSLLLKDGVECIVAFEPSTHMYSSLRERFETEKKVKTICGCFDVRYLNRSCSDSVVYINVLEHIEDDTAELDKAFDALKPGGHLLLFVPALSWLYGGLDERIGHFRRYHRRKLILLLERAGFSVVQAKYFDLLGILLWYVNFVLFDRPMEKGDVLLYDRMVVPFMRILEALVPPPAGKNILAIGKKLQ